MQSGNQQCELSKIDKYMTEDFVTKLSYETCNTVFESSNTDSKSICPEYLLEDRLFKLSFNDGQKWY
jgi:hypothetical protein